MSTKNYRIRFVSGEFAGRSFAVLPEGTLIGKSRVAAIRPGSAEIEIEHAVLRVDPATGALMIESKAETVFVQKIQLPPGTECSLEPGMDVRLGTDLSFVAELDEGLPADAASPAPEAADEETADDDQPTEEAPAADEGAAADEVPAVEERTRYASSAELEELRVSSRRKVRKKRTLLVTGGLGVLGLLLAAFLVPVLRQENPVTWPGETDNTYNDGECRIDLPPDGKFLIYFPQARQTRIVKDKNNCEVLTLLGKRRDVLFHLKLTVRDVPGGYAVSRNTSFQRWYHCAAEKEGLSFLSVPEDKFYAQTASGYPYQSLNYRRKDKTFQWQGIVSYLRYHDKEIIFMREVPFRDYWRTENVLGNYACFVASPYAVNSYWEIPEKLPQNASIATLYKNLLSEMWDNLAVKNWPEIKEQFAVLLSLAHSSGDKAMIRDALGLWKEFRERQQTWYVRSCLAYQNAQNTDNVTVMSRIVNECLRKFPFPDDYRHTKILKNIWTVD